MRIHCTRVEKMWLFRLMPFRFDLAYYFRARGAFNFNGKFSEFDRPLLGLRRKNSDSYDKRDDFNFNITNFPFLSSNIPSSPAFCVFISQLILYARALLMNVLF